MANIKEKKVYSSKFVFFWISVSLAAMVGFMFVCKEMGVLNPRDNWEREFAELSKLVLDFHGEDSQDFEKLMSDDDIEESFKKYAGTQIKLRSMASLLPAYSTKIYLNKKQLSIVKFTNLIGSSEARKTLSLAVFPIAKRQLAKTFKFAQGSFLWHAYIFEKGEMVKIQDEKSPALKGQLNLVAANYMNDYFIIATSTDSHSEIVKNIVESLSLYHSDFIKTL